MSKKNEPQTHVISSASSVSSFSSTKSDEQRKLDLQKALSKLKVVTGTDPVKAETNKLAAINGNNQIFKRRQSIALDSNEVVALKTPVNSTDDAKISEKKLESDSSKPSASIVGLLERLKANKNVVKPANGPSVVAEKPKASLEKSVDVPNNIPCPTQRTTDEPTKQDQSNQNKAAEKHCTQSDTKKSEIAEIEKIRDPRIQKRRMSMLVEPVNNHNDRKENDQVKSQPSESINILEEIQAIRDPRIRQRRMSMLIEPLQPPALLKPVNAMQRRQSMFIDPKQVSKPSLPQFKKFNPNILPNNPSPSIKTNPPKKSNKPTEPSTNKTAVAANMSPISSSSDNMQLSSISESSNSSPFSMSSLSDFESQVSSRSISDDKKLKLSSQIKTSNGSEEAICAIKKSSNNVSETSNKEIIESQKLAEKQIIPNVTSIGKTETDQKSIQNVTDVKPKQEKPSTTAVKFEADRKARKQSLSNLDLCATSHPKFSEPVVKYPNRESIKNFKIPKKSDVLKSEAVVSKPKLIENEPKKKLNSNESKKPTFAVDRKATSTFAKQEFTLKTQVTHKSSVASMKTEAAAAEQNDAKNIEVLANLDRKDTAVTEKPNKAATSNKRKCESETSAQPKQKRNRELEKLHQMNAEYFDGDSIAHSYSRSCKKDSSTSAVIHNDFKTRECTVVIEKLPNLDFTDKIVLRQYELHQFQNAKNNEIPSNEPTIQVTSHVETPKKTTKRKSSWARGVIPKKARGLNDSWEDVDEDEMKLEVVRAAVFSRIVNGPGRFDRSSKLEPAISKTVTNAVSTVEVLAFFTCRLGVGFQCGICGIRTPEEDLFTEHLEDHNKTNWTGSCQICKTESIQKLPLEDELTHLLTHVDMTIDNNDVSSEEQTVINLNAGVDPKHKTISSASTSTTEQKTTQAAPIHPCGEVPNMKEWIIKPWSSETTWKLTDENCEHPKRLASLYKCMDKYCAYYTDSMDLFTRHLSCHSFNEKSGNDFLSCSYCDEFKSTKHSDLTEHVKAKHECSSFLCGYCYFRALSIFQVNHHQKTYHEGKPRKVLHNKNCPTRKPNMKEIRDTLNGYIKPYFCPGKLSRYV